MPFSRRQIAWVSVACIALAGMYVFQRVNYAGLVLSLFGIAPGENVIFVINRTLRLLVNDSICAGIVVILFEEQRFRKIAWMVLAVEVLVLLPGYLILKLSVEGASEISSPLLSFIHRLIVNPTLMILTIIALAYEKFLGSKPGRR